jgi:hypothetical protein
LIFVSQDEFQRVAVLSESELYGELLSDHFITIASTPAPHNHVKISSHNGTIVTAFRNVRNGRTFMLLRMS